MNEKPFIIYKSSAGSGKTFTLAKEYVKLALRSEYYYKHILAVTFTNKAAEEMRERIIAFLIFISKGEGDIFEVVLEETKLDRQHLIQKAQKSLSAILHGYSFFSITTIDTFFHKIIRTFTREMGLQGNFSIEMDLDMVLDEVINKLLEEVHENQTLKEWLVDFSKERLLEGKNWEFRTDIKKLAYELFKEEYKTVTRHDNEDVDRESKIKAFVGELNRTIGSFQNELNKLANRALKELEENGLAPEDFAYGNAGPIALFVKTAKGDFSPAGKRTLEAIEKVEKWSSKSSPQKNIIEELANNSLIPIAKEMVALYHDRSVDYLSASELKKYIYTYGILSNISAKINTYREENDVMLISDFSSFLNDIISGSDAPYIYEKVGTKIRHYLIDEFQDTSEIQWKNFFPLIEDSIASGQQNMIVGDVKQSIYRWRGGDFNLLQSGVHQSVGVHQTEEHNLNTNYRSLPTIINFNNELFASASNWTKKGIDLEHVNGELEAIDLAFKDVAQKTMRTGEEGQVEIIFKEDDKENNYIELASQEVIKKVESLQDNGYDLKDIAILVRTHGEAKTVTKALFERKRNQGTASSYKYDVVSSESMFLNASPVVRFLISVLTFLDDQGNKIALKELLHQYHRDILQDDEDSNNIFMCSQEGTLLPDSFWKFKEVLIRLPFYELIETLIRIFELKRLDQEYAFLVGFQDCILNFSKDGESNMADFLQWWKETGVKKTVNMPDSLEAIKILTIHKSKGLQFKCVIIPFCNWNLDHNATQETILWAETKNIKEFNTFEHLPVKYSKRLLDTHLEPKYRQEKIMAHIDNLNVLYVAFTRAEEQMTIICKEPSNKGLKSVADIMQKYIGSSEQTWISDGQRHTLGQINSKEQSTIKPKAETVLEDYISHPWRKRIATKTTNANFVGVVEEGGTRRHFGILIHDLMAQVVLHDDIRQALDKISEMNLTEEAKSKATDVLNKIMELSELKEWFSDRYTIKTEAPILTKNGPSKRPDRIMIDKDKAIILDYKTGGHNQKDVEQMIEYQNLLLDMGYKDVEAYLLYIKDAKLQKVA